MMPNCDHLAHVPHFVYRIFDQDDVLLYVGCTINLRTRLHAHRNARPEWGPRAHTAKVIGPFVGKNARARAMRVERRLIATERPEFNVQFNRSPLRAA